MTKLKIGVVDDHAMFRDGLMINLNTHFHITLKAENGIDMIEKLEALNESEIPEIIIVDIKMPEMDGFETVKWLRSNLPQIKILILTMSDDSTKILEMYKLGVKSYLTKNMTSKELIEAITAVSDGELYINQKIAKIILLNAIKNSTMNSLTQRESQILELLCSDKTYREIAIELKLSVRTVEVHRENIFRKLDVNNRTSLALKAAELNLLKK
jgi:two-component system invasion response regulator UvrY